MPGFACMGPNRTLLRKLLLLPAASELFPPPN